MKKIFLFLSVVALLAAGCNSSQQANNQTAVQTPVSQTQTSNNNLVITEWSVQFQKPAGMNDLQYITLGNGLNGVSDNVAFVTKSLTDLDISTGGKYCTANLGPLGTLSRLKDLTSYGQAPFRQRQNG